MAPVLCVIRYIDEKGDRGMQRSVAAIAAALGLALALSACTDPYDPGQRAVGGGLLGAGAGAAIPAAKYLGVPGKAVHHCR